MPLILSVTESDLLEIGDYVIEVAEIFGDGRVNLVVDDKLVEIGDTKATEILPEVFVAAGLLANNPNFVRLIFTAPRSIGIGRYNQNVEENVNADGP